MVGAIIGAYKPNLEGAGLQKDAGALHEAALNELTSKNCTLQVHTFICTAPRPEQCYPHALVNLS